MVVQLVVTTLADVGNPLDQQVSIDCAALILTGTGILGATAANAVIALVLRIIGFAAAGVMKGSFAAWWQSTMPLVSAGSVFAKLTSIAMSAGGAGATGTTIGAVLGVGGGAAAITWTPLANVCKRVDEEVAQGSVAGATLQANTRAVQAVLSSAELAGKTAKEVYDATPAPVKAAAEQVAEKINSAYTASADAVRKTYDAVTSKAADVADAAKPALDKVTQAVGDAAASSTDTMGNAYTAAASKIVEARAAAAPGVEERLKEVSEAMKHVFDELPRWLRSRL